MDSSMNVLTYTPCQPLADFVELLWYSHSAVPAHGQERRLPTATMELVINLGQNALRVYDPDDIGRFESFRDSVLSGAHSRYFVIDTAPQASMIGVHFRPGGAFPFIPLPVAELRNRHLPPDALWGRTGGELRERLLEAGRPEAMFFVLEQWLLRQARYNPTWHPAVRFALRDFQKFPATRPVSDVAMDAGLSTRRFITLFKNQVGLRPKEFCRVMRFQRALRRIEGRQQVEWAHLAQETGYFDQAHFIRDFRAFSGLVPSTYLRIRGAHRNHVSLTN